MEDQKQINLMKDQKQTSFTFEIDNFSEKEGVIASPKFLSRGCEWYVGVYPKGDNAEGYLSLNLYVANPESLRLGWKRRAKCSFLLLDQSGKVLYRTDELWCQLFCAQLQGWGLAKAVPLKKLQEKGFLENNKLIVKVEVKVLEVVDESEVTGNETLYVQGFQLLYPQFVSVTRLLTKHPDFATNFKPKNQLVKTTYMNILLGHIEALDKPPHSLSDTELSNAYRDLIELTEAGFNLDWLKKKLYEVIVERKKEDPHGLRVEENIETLNIELNKERVKPATSADKDFSLEQAMWNLRDELDKEKAKSSTSGTKDWLEGVVRSWNQWKLRLGFADLGYKKMN
ncbi:unnamed protein product [Thlaspi arvense]|uniref:MATH domain-containing protein n=1 Tax=Thlaspi arvense TaxID=13288 RepID=A0AAU9RTC6_THLAR|nr:unnamed protein product [Thlaspi arvense]